MAAHVLILPELCVSGCSILDKTEREFVGRECEHMGTVTRIVLFYAIHLHAIDLRPALQSEPDYVASGL